MFGIGKKQETKQEITAENLLSRIIAIVGSIEALEKRIEIASNKQKELEMLYERYNRALLSVQEDRLQKDNEFNSKLSELYKQQEESMRVISQISLRLDTLSHKMYPVFIRELSHNKRELSHNKKKGKR